MELERANHISPVAHELILTLLREPTAEKEKFSQLSLNDIGLKLRAIEVGTCHATFCLLLHALEIDNREELFDVPIEAILYSIKAPPRLPMGLSHTRAQEHLRVYEFFIDRHTKQFAFSEECYRKITAQWFCFAIESEITFRTSHALKKLWPTREALLQPLLTMVENKIRFAPEFADRLQKILEKHPTLAFGGSLEDPIYINTFKYMLHIGEPNEFKPNLAEAGLLLLSLPNELGISGIGETEREELALRLFRLHKIKAKSLSVYGDFDENLWEIFSGDRDRILMALKNLGFSKAEELQEVA